MAVWLYGCMAVCTSRHRLCCKLEQNTRELPGDEALAKARAKTGGSMRTEVKTGVCHS